MAVAAKDPNESVDHGALSPLSEVGRRLARLRLLQQSPSASAPVRQAEFPAERREPAIAGGPRASDNGRH
jgi:hypothetical protein